MIITIPSSRFKFQFQFQSFNNLWTCFYVIMVLVKLVPLFTWFCIRIVPKNMTRQKRDKQFLHIIKQKPFPVLVLLLHERNQHVHIKHTHSPPPSCVHHITNFNVVQKYTTLAYNSQINVWLLINLWCNS